MRAGQKSPNFSRSTIYIQTPSRVLHHAQVETDVEDVSREPVVQARKGAAAKPETVSPVRPGRPGRMTIKASPVEPMKTAGSAETDLTARVSAMAADTAAICTNSRSTPFTNTTTATKDITTTTTATTGTQVTAIKVRATAIRARETVTLNIKGGPRTATMGSTEETITTDSAVVTSMKVSSKLPPHPSVSDAGSMLTNTNV